MAIVTLSERKAAEAVRRKRAADDAVRQLRGYAQKHSGSFVVFGSYVRDTMRFDSDLDVLVDFPPERSGDAWRFAEDVCASLSLPLDVHDARTTKAAFAARIRSKGLVLS